MLRSHVYHVLAYLYLICGLAVETIMAKLWKHSCLMQLCTVLPVLHFSIIYRDCVCVTEELTETDNQYFQVIQSCMPHVYFMCTPRHEAVCSCFYILHFVLTRLWHLCLSGIGCRQAWEFYSSHFSSPTKWVMMSSLQKQSFLHFSSIMSHPYYKLSCFTTSLNLAVVRAEHGLN